MFNRIMKFTKKKKKGFTLVEVIVVLVILAVIIALAVPSVMKYVDDANDVKDDIKVSHLNKATEGYRVRRYGNKEWAKGSDLFVGTATDKARQKILIDAEWLEEYQVSIYDSNNYFHWDITKQKWTRKESSSEEEQEKPELDATIMGDPGRGNDRGPWSAGTSYNHNDIIIKDGISYKCVWPYGSITSNKGPGNFENYWKVIKLEFDKNNRYETNDIITYKGEYYKATGFDTITTKDYLAFVSASASYFNDSVIIKELFTKVIWKDGKFINA